MTSCLKPVGSKKHREQVPVEERQPSVKASYLIGISSREISTLNSLHFFFTSLLPETKSVTKEFELS
jgi:hypothetical protein